MFDSCWIELQRGEDPLGRFSNKVLLVTGAASGIAEAAARRFGQEGATLVLADQNAEGSREVADTIEVADVLAEVADCRSRTNARTP